MRTIRVGDMVQAFLSPEIKGEVVKIKYVRSGTHLVGGTATQIMVCEVQLNDGSVRECKAADLFHV